jgi:uncharacterized cupin superfamily protein
MSASLPISAVALQVPPRDKPSSYPAPFAARVSGRIKRALGDHFGLANFGVNLTTLNPGACSALYHRHSVQDEFIYVLDGEIVLLADGTETVLSAGMCAGFPAGGVAHQLVNRSAAAAMYLEIGDRLPGDAASYPDDDLVASSEGDRWVYTRRDGTPY